MSLCTQFSNSTTTCILSLLIHGHVFVGHPLKHRKRHRRRNSHNQELSIMRGVYFKNMKWQAAIKVDKKQIHLGTFGSQEEAAHLYDRYTFSESFLISLLTIRNWPSYYFCRNDHLRALIRGWLDNFFKWFEFLRICYWKTESTSYETEFHVPNF